MRRLLSFITILSITRIFAFAQSTPVEVNEPLILHYLDKRAVIHADRSSSPTPYDEVQLEVIVTPLGTVEYAHAIHGPAGYFLQAEEVEMARRFKPFHKDGKAVKASVEDYVMIVPREQWGARQPFPDVMDWSSLRFTLHRPPGYFEDSPAYFLEVRGDGTVIFAGENSTIPGKYQGRISRQQVARLLEKFRRADYFSLKDTYALPATDLEEINTSLTIDGKTKRVRDYGGLTVGMPEAVTALEVALDKAAVASFRTQSLNEQADKLEAMIALRH